jgi:hypothetical protein
MEDATWRLGDCVSVASACDGVANGAVTTPATEPLPDDVQTLKAMFMAQLRSGSRPQSASPRSSPDAYVSKTSLPPVSPFSVRQTAGYGTRVRCT